jgi:hypothetical protein
MNASSAENYSRSPSSDVTFFFLPGRFPLGFQEKNTGTGTNYRNKWPRLTFVFCFGVVNSP